MKAKTVCFAYFKCISVMSILLSVVLSELRHRQRILQTSFLGEFGGQSKMQILMYFQLAPPPFSCNSRFPPLAQDGVVRNVILYFTADKSLGAT